MRVPHSLSREHLHKPPRMRCELGRGEVCLIRAAVPSAPADNPASARYRLCEIHFREVRVGIGVECPTQNGLPHGREIHELA